MADYLKQYTQAEEEKLARKIKAVYKQAANDAKGKLKAFTAAKKEKSVAYLKKVKAGELDMADYQAWLQGQVFQGKQWQQKVDDLTAVYMAADQKARELLGGTEKNVFAEAANYTAYGLEHGMSGAVAFNIYDKHTVERLLKDNPQTLPKWKIDEDKDYTWNARRVRNAVTQGIIQGESVDQIGARLTTDLAASNGAKMTMFARTAITGAQNAGRMDRLHEAQDMGIEVKKKWLATLDNRTRDAHQELDGQEVDIDEPFHCSLGSIMYPGDPSADPANVYNCRCTLTYVYPKFGSHGKRYVQEDGGTIDEGINYKEWKQAKEANRLDDLDAAKDALGDAMLDAVEHDAFHVFKGIWKDDVTYADYYDKLPSINAKRDYYVREIERQKKLGNTAKALDLTSKLAELDKFEQMGAANYGRLIAVETGKKNVADIVKDITPTPPAPPSPFGQNAYTQARKDAALWAKSPKDADAVLRSKSGEVWRGASDAERDAAYEYTVSYHKYNEPLRGTEYGSNRYLGVGNTDLNASYANNGERLNKLTDIIDKSTYKEDVWLQRGVNYEGTDKFLGVSEDLLRYGSQSDLEAALLGTTPTEYGFMSCGSSKGKGFDHCPIIYNVYAPSGTKMLYVEPFSGYGGSGAGLGWDGLTGQSRYGSEVETLMQQGTKFMITKVERTSSKLYIDMEVIDQSFRQYWKAP